MTNSEIPLGAVSAQGTQTGLRRLLEQRRSTRRFAPRPLAVAHLADLAWAALGHTADGRRTRPSAHALYPLTLTVVAGDVDGLQAGIHRYVPERHALAVVDTGDHRESVAGTTLVDRDWVRRAPALLLLSGDLDQAVAHFADQPPPGRGRRYVWLEAGHAAQNVYLWAAEAGLGAVLIAGFDDDRLRALCPGPIVPPGHHPLALLAVGHPAE